MTDVQHFSGTVTPVASTTSKCGLVVTPGAEPTVVEPGGIWYDTGDDCLVYFAPDGTKTYLPKGTGLAGQVLTSNGLDTVPTYQAHTPTPPGGSDKQLQYNNATAFGGISNGNIGEVLISAGAGAIPAFGPHGLLLHGVVPPVDLTDGANGDFFLDTATSTLYGPKAGGAWPVGVSLIGPQGNPGAGVGLIAVGKLGQVTNNVAGETSIIGTLTSLNIPAGTLNAVGRKLIVRGSGYLTTAGGETPTFTLSCKVGGAVIGTFTTAALTASKTIRFDYQFEMSVTLIGAAGTVITRGILNIDLAGNDTYTTYRNISVAGGATIDLTSVAGINVYGASSANISSCTTDDITSQAF